jgi:hypothetical protein
MSSRRDRAGGDVLATVALRAVSEARWQAADVLSRKPAPVALDLLRARAAELAMSPLGRDQVMSVALLTVVDDVTDGGPPLADGALFFFGASMEPRRRLPMQRRVFAALRPCDGEADAVVRQLEAEHPPATPGAEIAARLLDDARLHKQLWDDPRIPADLETRLVMLCSVPRLVDRARELDPLRLRALRPIARWSRRRTL